MDKLANWSRDAYTDSYTYTYACGHSLSFPGVRMQMGGQVAPPICPTCHGQKAIDVLESENWRKDPNWTGYANYEAINNPSNPFLLYTAKNLPGLTGLSLAPSGPLAWLDLQLDKVRTQAWR